MLYSDEVLIADVMTEMLRIHVVDSTHVFTVGNTMVRFTSNSFSINKILSIPINAIVMAREE